MMSEVVDKKIAAPCCFLSSELTITSTMSLTAVIILRSSLILPPLCEEHYYPPERLEVVRGRTVRARQSPPLCVVLLVL